MSKELMISIHPEYCQLILSGCKTLEVRKTRPKIEPPFKCYIYCTKDKHGGITGLEKPDGGYIFSNGNVIAEFICDRIDIYTTVIDAKHECTISDEAMHQGSGLTEGELRYYEHSSPWEDFRQSYFGLFGWHISKLSVFKKPCSLSDFGLKRAPQSWCYVNGEEAHEQGRIAGGVE